MFVVRGVLLMATVVCVPALGTEVGHSADAGGREEEALPSGAILRIGTAAMTHGGWIGNVAFTPDGRAVASGSSDGTVRLWDVETGQARMVLPSHGNDAAGTLAVSADGRMLARVGRRLATVVDICDTTSGTTILQLGDHDTNVGGVAFFPDNRRLATASGATIRVWDLPSGADRHQYKRVGHQIYAMAVSPDGETIASGTLLNDRWRITLLKAADGKVQKEFIVPDLKKNYWLHSLVFSNDSRFLACTLRGELRLWETGSGRLVRTLSTNQRAAVAFTPDGQGFVVGDQSGIVLYELQTARPVRQFRGLRRGARALALSPDGTCLAAGGRDNCLGLWEVRTGRLLHAEIGQRSSVNAVAFLPCDEPKARPGRSAGLSILYGTEGGMIYQHRVTDGQRLRTIDAFPAGVRDLDASKDGRRLAAVGRGESTIHVWQVAGGNTLFRAASGHPDGSAVAISDDGSLVAGANHDDGMTRVWDLASGDLLHSFRFRTGPNQWVIGMDFAADPDRLVAYANHGAGAISFDPTSGHMTRSPLADLGDNPRQVAFSPDGSWVACARTGQVDVHDTKTLRSVWQVAHGDGHRFPQFWAVAWSADGRYLATGSGDIISDLRQDETFRPQRIEVWELLSGSEVLLHRGHHARVSDLAFSPDGRMLASGSQDTTVLVWPVEPTDEDARQEKRGDVDEKYLWDALGADARQAHAAKWRLVRSPEIARTLFQSRLFPAVHDVGEIRDSIRQLDSSAFTIRQRAIKQLRQFGDQAIPEIRKALVKELSAEARNSLRALLGQHNPLTTRDVEVLRSCRAIEVVERIGRPWSKELLSTLATGSPSSRITQHAQAALKRLEKSSPGE